jgi:hypothetical protein
MIVDWPRVILFFNKLYRRDGVPHLQATTGLEPLDDGGAGGLEKSHAVHLFPRNLLPTVPFPLARKVDNANKIVNRVCQ